MTMATLADNIPKLKNHSIMPEFEPYDKTKISNGMTARKDISLQ